jgi:electron transfer flavoprotein beta subunit
VRILVCIKRVPAPGARINLSEDGRSIDARHLSFTTSPHEECAVEEAIRLKEKHGGSTTVLTFGPAEAEEQLRYAVSLGIDQAVLVEDNHTDRDPQATAGAITEAVKKLEAAEGGFDLLLFGNESADSGGYQVGIRVARSLARPIVSGIKSIDIDEARLTARRQTSEGFEVYRVDLPAVMAVKEGINLPRYPTMPGRLRSRKSEIHHMEAGAEGGGLEMLRLISPPEQVSETVILGSGAEAAPKVVSVIRELGLL